MDLSQLTVTKIISVHELYNDGATEKTRFSRERWALIYKYEGETHYTVGDSTLLSSPTSLIVLPKDSDYTWRCTRSGHFIAIELECIDAKDAIPFTVSVKDPGELLRDVRELLRKYRAGAARTELLSLLYGLITRLVTQNAYVPRSKSEKIAPALAVLNGEYQRNITNDELSSLCGISEVYFRKLFFDVFKTSPIHYLHRIRIERAKEMLRSDFGKIGDVGEAVGYPSIYHFSKMFKLYVGTSPTEYINNL